MRKILIAVIIIDLLLAIMAVWTRGKFDGLAFLLVLMATSAYVTMRIFDAKDYVDLDN